MKLFSKDILYKKSGRLPSEYQEVEWIGFTGEQYFDTGLVLTVGSSVEADILFNSLSNARWFGEGWDCMIATNNNMIPTCVAGQWNDDWNSPYLATGVKYNIIADYQQGNYKLYVDGILKQDKNITLSINYGQTAYVGVVNSTTYRMTGGDFKIYSLKITVNDEIVRHYIPCYRKSDGVTGFYDIINNQFKINEGTGSFLRPTTINDYQKVEWVGSTGTQYINTGYSFDSNSKYYIKLMFTTKPSDLYAYGTYNPNTTLQANSGNSYVSFGGNNNFFSKDYVTINEILEVENSSTYARCNDETLTYEAQTISTTKQFYLFKSNGLSQSYAGYQRVYSFKLWDNNTLVRDMVPCYRKSDSVIGMFDMVNNIFYTNSGSGTFTKGDDV